MKTSLQLYLPLNSLQGFERVVQGLYVRGCWRPNINFIFWPPLLMTVTLCLSCSPDVGVYSIGAFWGPPRSGVSSLPHLVSSCLEFYWQLLWDPNSTELNNNSTPTRSPTGSLNRMFNRHQAEITVMQFRGYSLPVHHCSGTMGPSPCPIS